jgi:DNA-directed RNA polymerase subunit beta'
VVITDAKGEEHAYTFPRRTRLYVEHGEKVETGHQLNEGSLYPAELLQIRGRGETERYLVKEVQEVYKSQGVDINDKHIELIGRQMLKRVRIERKGDSGCLPGSLVDGYALRRLNESLKKSKKKAEQATAEEVILGITKASLATDSFLSAASFQETTKVLTDASLEGKIDRLLGLKENVIIGKLIPAATGLKHYRTVEIEPTEPVQRPTPEEIGLLDEEQLAAELGLDGEGLEGLGAEISTEFGDDFATDFDLGDGGGAQPATKDGEET